MYNNVFKSADEIRERALLEQRLDVERMLTGCSGLGGTAYRYDKVILPEITKELTDKGFDVTVNIQEDGIGYTIISWAMSVKKHAGSLIIYGPENISMVYYKQWKAHRKEIQLPKINVQKPQFTDKIAKLYRRIRRSDD